MSLFYDTARGTIANTDRHSGVTPNSIFGNRAEARQYTKYSEMGGQRKGIFSGLDHNITNAEVNRQQSVWGEGFVRLAMLDESGHSVTDRPLNLDGKVHYSDPDGTFTIVDGTMLQASAKLENERNEAIRQIIKYAGKSDHTLAMTLGVTVQKMRDELGIDGDCWGQVTQQELLEVDATPEAMGLTDSTSISFARASQKMRIAIKVRKPIVSFDMTPSSAKSSRTAKDEAQETQDVEAEAEAEN